LSASQERSIATLSGSIAPKTIVQNNPFATDGAEICPDINELPPEQYHTLCEMKKAILILIILAGSICGYTQKTDNKPVTTSFWVAGVCGMCEQTIEAALDAKGVIKADFSLSNNLLTVTYKPKKISEQQLHVLLNEAGYDTEKSTCTDEQYARVHGCCKYRELEKH
jgi:mercuric ion binding protein